MSFRRQSGFTLVELLVTLAVVSVLLLLTIATLPQVREAARRNQCQNNLRQLVLACHNYNAVHKSWPSGLIPRHSAFLWNGVFWDRNSSSLNRRWMIQTSSGLLFAGGSGGTDPVYGTYTASGNQHHGDWAWSTFILPQLNHSQKYQQLRCAANNASDVLAQPPLATILASAPAVFQCPSNTLPRNSDRGNGDPLLDALGQPHPGAVALVSYVGHFGRGRNDVNSRWHMLQLDIRLQGPFNASSACTFDMMLDGAANSIALGERAWEYPDANGRMLPSHAARMYMALADLETATGASDALGHSSWGINFPFAGHSPGAHSNSQSKAMTGYSSQHAGGANFAMCDGSVRFLSQNIDHNTSTTAVDSIFEALADMRDGSVVPAF